MRRYITIIAVLALPIAVGMVSCKNESKGCGECATVFDSNPPGSNKCAPCWQRVDDIEDLMAAPECCGCPTYDDTDTMWTPDIPTALSGICQHEILYNSHASPEFACRYGLETMTCEPWDTGGDGLGPYGDESPLTDAWTTGSESSEASAGTFDPTGGDIGECPDYALWQCSGWAIGVYGKVGSSDSWKAAQNCPEPYACQICFGWEGDNDPNYADLDVTHGLKVCAMTEDEARDRCEAECPAYLDGYFPNAGGAGWTLKEIHCDFHGAETSVPSPDHHPVPSAVTCYEPSAGIVDGELHEANVVIVPGVPCPEEDCPSTSECSAWNNASSTASPSYNVGRTADTTYVESFGIRQYLDHKLRVDDDFWRDLFSEHFHLLTTCDAPRYDLVNGDLDGTFNANDLLTEMGFNGSDYDFKVAGSTAGPWYSIKTNWFDAMATLFADTEIYVQWKRAQLIGYHVHRAKITIAECGSAPCPNPP